MANFDLDGYLSRRYGTSTGTDKLTSLAQASQEKMLALEARYEESLQQQAANKDSWVSQLGLEPGSISADAVNLGASLYSGASRLAGQLTGLRSNFEAIADESHLNAADIDAYNRYTQGEASHTDQARLTTTRTRSGLSALELFERAAKSRQEGKDVAKFFDNTGAVHQTNRKGLSDDLKDSFDQEWSQVKEGWDGVSNGKVLKGTADLAAGLGKLLVNAGDAVISNPMAALEYTVENAPQLLVGGLAGAVGKGVLTASNVGYAADYYRQGIEAHQAKNNGALPVGEERQRIATYAASLALAEQFGDMVGLGVMKAGKALKGTEEAVRTGFKQSLLNTGKAATLAGTTEAGTEGYQTFAEGEILGKPATAADIYEGAVIGGVAGAGLSGGVRGLAEMAKATPEHAQVRQDKAKEQATFLERAQSGDTAAYLDPKSPEYAPAKAMAVLFANNQKPDTTPEQRQVNRDQADTIVADLEAQHTKLREQYEHYSPERLQQVKNSIKAKQKKLAGLDPTDTAQATELQEQITGLQEWEGKFATYAKDIADTKAKLDQLDAQLSEARKLRSGIEGQAPVVDQNELDEAITQATTSEDVPTRQAAAARLVTLSMASPQGLSSDVAAQLEQDTSNGLSEAQRSYLRQFSKTRTLVNQMKKEGGVHQDILVGREGTVVKGERIPRMLGIQDYQQEVGTALASGKQKQADFYLGLLRKFVADHSAKADALGQGLDRFKQGEVAQVLKNTLTGEWEVDTNLIPYGTANRNGGYTFREDRSHDKFVGRVRAEATVLQETLKELESAYALTFQASPAAPVMESTETTPVEVPVDSQASSGRSSELSTVEGQTQSNVDSTVDSVESEPSTVAQDAPVVNAESTEESQSSSTQVPTVPAEELGAPAEVLEAAPSVVERAPKHLFKLTKKGYYRALREAEDESGTGQETLDTFATEFSAEVARIKALPRLGDQAEALQRLNTYLNSEQIDFDVFPAEYGQLNALARGLVMDADGYPNKTVEGMLKQLGKFASPEYVEEHWAKFDALNTDSDTQDVIDALQGLIQDVQEVESKQGQLDFEKLPTSATEEQGAAGASAEAAPATKVEEKETKAEEATISEGLVETQGSESVEAGVSTENSGILSMYSQEDTGKDYKSANLIQRLTVQRKAKTTDKTASALVAVKDFLSEWVKDRGLILKQGFIDPDTILSDKQVGVTQLFRDLAQQWSKLAQSELNLNKTKEGSKEFLYQNPFQYFITENPDGSLSIDENVLTSMAYAGFSYVAEQAARGKDGLNTDDDINKLLLRDTDTPITSEEEVLRDVGMRHTVVFASLGRKAIQALGIKARKDAPSHFLPQLEAATGAMIAKMLIEAGVMEVRDISPDLLKKLMKESEGSRDKSFYGLRLTLKDGKISDLAEDIYNASAGSQSILDDIFKVEPSLREPTFKPVPFKHEYNRKGNKVPSKQAEILNKKDQEANYLDQDSWTVFSQTDEDILAQMAGEEDITPNMQVMRRNSIKAKNQGIRREIQNMFAFVNDVWQHRINEQDPTLGGLNAPIFFQSDMWKQQRVGLLNNFINPQTMKVVRALLFRKNWETQIESSSDMMNLFKLRVMEGLGIKTTNELAVDSLARFDALFDPELNERQEDKDKAQARWDAVEIFANTLEGEPLTHEQQLKLLKAVKLGGEKMHSWAALSAMGQMQVAQRKAEKQGKREFTFTSRLMGEIDGTNNGLILSMALLGGQETSQALTEFMHKGGIFEEGTGITQYNQWKSKGAQDAYESMIQAAIQKLVEYLKAVTQDRPIYGAIYRITGNLGTPTKIEKAGRNIIKTPVISLAFGSSPDKSVQGMADDFVEAVIKRIEALTKNAPEVSRVDLIKAINQIIIAGGGKPLSESMTVEQLLEWDNLDQVSALKVGFVSTFGEHVKAGLKEQLGFFLQQRNQLNKAAGLAFEIYSAFYQEMRKQYVEHLVKEGKLAVDGAGNPIVDLTQEQEQVIRDRLHKLYPVMHTAFSKASGELEAGIPMMKTERKLNQSLPYQAVVKYKNKVPGVRYRRKHRDGTTSVKDLMSFTGRGMSVVEQPPGAATTPFGAHSLDSNIMHEAIQDLEVLGVHDGAGVGLKDFNETARRLNQATWKALLNYSLPGEVYQGMMRTVREAAKLAKTGDTSNEMLTNLATKLVETWGVRKDFTDLTTMMDQLQKFAYNAEKTKLESMKTWAYVDQYAAEGGSYEITVEDRAGADIKLQQLKNKMSKQDKEAVQELDTLLRPYMEEAHRELLAKRNGKPTPAPKATSKATPKAKPQPKPETVQELVSALKTQGELTVNEVLPLLKEELRKARKNPASAFRYELLKGLSKVTSAQLTIHWVEREEEASAQPEKQSKAWYVPEKEEIYLLSSEFLEGAPTEAIVEALLHELTHAAAAKVIAQEEARFDPEKGADTPTQQAYRDLVSLLGQAQDFAEQNQLTGFEEALSNVQEFVAYGMTDPRFQKEVLERMQVKSVGDKLLDGMRAFANKLLALIFPPWSKSTQEMMETGMGVMVSSVANLLAEAHANPEMKWQGPVLSMANQIQGYTTQQVFKALDAGTLSPGFNDHLGELLSQVVEKLHGPFGVFKRSLMQNRTGSALDVWAEAQASGQTPFISSIPTSTFTMSEREAFVIEQVEATVRHALEDNTLQTTTTLRELVKLYKEAQDTLTVQDFHEGDWATASQDEQNLAQSRYDFVFKMQQGKDGRTDHLSRFAAMGLAHAGFYQKLDWATKRKGVDKPSSLTARLQQWFENLLAWFSHRVTHTYAGQAANNKLEMLITSLVAIEQRKQRALMKKELRAGRFDLVGSMEDSTRKGVDKVRQGLVKAAKSNLVQNKLGGTGKLISGAVQVLAGQHANKVINSVVHLFESSTQDHSGLVTSLLNELKGPREKFEALQRAATFHQKERQLRIGNTAQIVLSSFDGELKATEKAGVSMLLRTGAHVLLDHFDLAQIETLAKDSSKLDQAIGDWQAKLTGFGPVWEFYDYYAKVLAGNMVLGGNTDPNAYFNAKGIARLDGTPWASRISEQQANQAEPIIDVLTTLYAIKYAPQDTTTALQAVLRRENAREDQANGIEMVLKLHRKLEQESRERLFQDSELLMMKGYLPEIYNPYLDVKVANLQDGENLIDLGYAWVGEVRLDPTDPVQEERHLYVMKDGGPERWVTGVMLNKGQGTKGSKLHNGFLNPNTEEGKTNIAHQKVLDARRNHQVTHTLKVNRNFDPRKAPKHIMAPVRNAHGKVVNYRYLMQTTTKDSVLERDNRFEHLLGALAGSVYDKQVTPEHNTDVLNELKGIYDKDFARNAKKFVRVGPESTDAALRETYAVLPKATREQIKALWGKEGAWIPKDLVYPVFGYRKETLSKVYDKDFSDRNVAEKILTWTIDHMLYHYARMKLGKTSEQAHKYARRGALVLRKAEHMWQATVDVVKDTIVIRTGVVLAGNMASNVTLLKLAGVPWKFMAQKHAEALRGATDYMRDRRELQRLQTLLESGYTQGDEARIKREIAQVENALARNPVRRLIEGGLMPTIVEDLNDVEDIYSYKALFDRKVEEWSGKINPGVRKVARGVLMTKDSALYKGLRQATQLSDFVARYTLVEHLTQNEGMAEKEALFEASESFVNYDTPMHPLLQYTDDTGLTMFTKYFLRIQRVLMRHVKEHPLRVLTLALVDSYMDVAAVTDSSMLTRIGNNPLEWGAFQLPGVVDDIATVSAGVALVK